MHPQKRLRWCLGISSVIFAILGITLIFAWQIIFDALTSETALLKPQGTTFDLWRTNPLPIEQNFYLFNWSNPEEFYNLSVKPKFTQMGPYAFQQNKEKTDLVWNANKTVTFKLKKTWFFDPKRSNGTLKDRVTSIDPVFLSASYKARSWSYWLKKGFNLMLATATNKGITGNHSVGEVLFDGYNDELFSMSTKLPMFSSDGMPGGDKFGWFINRNGSEDYEGTFNMETGENEPLGIIKRWKYLNHTTYYQGECDGVTGYSGEFFPRKLRKDSVIRVFSPDLCRASDLEFDKEEIVKGILGYKFVAAKRFLDNGTEIPENKCFNDGQLPSGVMNATICKFNSPIFLSLPHFYNADKYYNEIIEGLNPQQEPHEFSMVLEPNFGILLKGAARLQLNLQVQPVKYLRHFDNAPNAYFPVLWFEQTVVTSDQMAFLIKIMVNFKMICKIVGAILIGIGLHVLAYLYCVKRMKKASDSKFITKEEVPLKSLDR